MSTDMKGMIFDIKRFSMHDGPGIRSTLFVKGCPLRCPWCQNPEGLERRPRLWYFPNKCIHCGSCIEACPTQAIGWSEEDGKPSIHIKHAQCSNIKMSADALCDQCVSACPAKAISFDGRVATVAQVVDELLKDRAFYERSGGGITISGGEPLYQPDFIYEVLKVMKAHGIHTAVETSLYANEGIVERLLSVVDLFITDIKIFDDETHRKVIGVSNKKIKQNFEFLARSGVELLVRTPLIPGYTADEDNLAHIADYVKNVKDDACMELINYNPLPVGKYRIMNKTFAVDEAVQPFSEAQMDAYRKILIDRGIEVIKE